MPHSYRPRHAARRAVRPTRYAAAAVLAGLATACTVAGGPASAATAPMSVNPATVLTQSAIALDTQDPAPTPAVLKLITSPPSAVAAPRAPLHLAATHRAAAHHGAGAHAGSLHVVRGHRLSHVHQHRHHVARRAGEPYVGPYSPAQLVARMHDIMALNGTGENLDPFFGSEPDGSWYRDCQHFVAVLDGRASSGYGSAEDAWYQFLSEGVAHPAYTAQGMNPPAGAWLYFGDNHVVVYLGHHKVAGTDTWGEGTAKIGPESAVARWLAFEGGYKGWVAPWGG